jgi:acid phosphatase (class A)
MRIRTLPSLFAVALALPTLAAQAPEPDWAAIAGSFPSLGTPEAAGERGALVWLHNVRTSRDVARVWKETSPTPECFAEAVGEDVSGSARPLTHALMRDAAREAIRVVLDLKRHFARPLPYQTYPGIDPAIPPVPPRGEGSFPSLHATLGAVLAQLFVQFRPERAEAIRDKGRLLGSDRVLAGLHYPSDVEAGERLGKAFAAWWISQPEHRQRILEACGAEWH